MENLITYDSVMKLYNARKESLKDLVYNEADKEWGTVDSWCNFNSRDISHFEIEEYVDEDDDEYFKVTIKNSMTCNSNLRDVAYERFYKSRYTEEEAEEAARDFFNQCVLEDNENSGTAPTKFEYLEDLIFNCRDDEEELENIFNMLSSEISKYI